VVNLAFSSATLICELDIAYGTTTRAWQITCFRVVVTLSRHGSVVIGSLGKYDTGVAIRLHMNTFVFCASPFAYINPVTIKVYNKDNCKGNILLICITCYA